MEELKKKALIEILARARYIDIKEDVLSAYVDVYKVVQMREEICQGGYVVYDGVEVRGERVCRMLQWV